MDKATEKLMNTDRCGREDPIVIKKSKRQKRFNLHVSRWNKVSKPCFDNFKSSDSVKVYSLLQKIIHFCSIIAVDFLVFYGMNINISKQVYHLKENLVIEK